MEKNLILFGDYHSQPSRAIFAFCLMTKIPHVVSEVKVMNLDQYKEEFKKLNPNGKVPAILDHGFNLYESHTILRYLATSRDCPDHWYPTDFKKRAKINEYLDWHHNNIRLGAGVYFFRKYVSGLTGKPAPASLIQESYDMIEKSCSTIEKMFFYHDKTYMFGD